MLLNARNEHAFDREQSRKRLIKILIGVFNVTDEDRGRPLMNIQDEEDAVQGLQEAINEDHGGKQGTLQKNLRASRKSSQDI